MGIPRLFKIPKHREFNYQPLYYNPAKEELEKRIEQIKRETGEELKTYTPTIQKGQMRGYFKKISVQKRRSNLRLVIILVVLFLLAYYLLYT